MNKYQVTVTDKIYQSFQRFKCSVFVNGLKGFTLLVTSMFFLVILKWLFYEHKNSQRLTI